MNKWRNVSAAGAGGDVSEVKGVAILREENYYGSSVRLDAFTI